MVPNWIVPVAEEVKTLLNAAAGANSFSPYTFTASRRYAPYFERNAFTGIAVSVVPHALDVSLITRDRQEGIFDIRIYVQSALKKPEELTEIDPLTGLPDAIGTFFEQDARRVLPTTKAALMKTAMDPFIYTKELYDQQMFSAAVILTYEQSRKYR